VTITNDQKPSPRGRGEGIDDIPRQRFFDLVPKRNLAKIAVLVAMLAAIVALQRRSGSIAGCVQTSLFPQPRARSATPAPEVR
jgi:hypothetical protein